MSSQTIWHLLKWIALGAVSFWVRDILWQAITGPQFAGRDVIGITVLMPPSLLATYTLVKKHHGRVREDRYMPCMLVGLWILGGFFVTVGAIF